MKIYEKQGNLQTSNAEFNAINGAIQDWNTIKVTGCSGVTFANATRANEVWPQGDFNYQFINKEVLVVRSDNEDGRFQEIKGTNGLRGGYAILHSNFTHDVIPQGKGPLYRVDNLAKHEVGHSFGVRNGENSAILSAMGQNSFDATNTLQITACDVDAHKRLYCPPTPTPTPTPEPPPDPPSCDPNGAGMDCFYATTSYCNCVSDLSLGFWNEPDCECYFYTPIVIDTAGNGFSLTNAANGVDFDLTGDGLTERLSWTSAGSDDAWLALDRNRNGVIDDGTELFGNFAPQPAPPPGEMKNGFLALAEFDKPENGGNFDGQIDRRDAVFDRLRLWRDTNHNGISESEETVRLSKSPIRVMELNYYESRRTDENGNQFRYRAIVRDEYGAQVGRWAWDVFLRRDVSVGEVNRKTERNTFSSLRRSCSVLLGAS